MEGKNLRITILKLLFGQGISILSNTDFNLTPVTPNAIPCTVITQVTYIPSLVRIAQTIFKLSSGQKLERLVNEQEQIYMPGNGIKTMVGGKEPSNHPQSAFL
jgi:hypothetical protein